MKFTVQNNLQINLFYHGLGTVLRIDNEIFILIR